MGSPKGPKIQNHASVNNLQKQKRPRERSWSPRTPTSSSDNLTFQVSSQRLMVAKGDPQPTSPVMIATPLIIYIASRSRPVPTDAEHGQGDDEAGILVIHFLLARSLLRDASLPSSAFLETRLKALLNLNSFHDVGQGDALPTLNPVDEADGVDPE